MKKNFGLSSLNRKLFDFYIVKCFLFMMLEFMKIKYVCYIYVKFKLIINV